MAAINKSKLKQVKEYYQDGLSAREIAERLGVSLDAVYYFFRKHKIPRRRPKENNFLQFQKKPLSFKIKNNLSSSEKILKVAGAMLYWAEGSKWPGERIVDFANSDPAMVKIFLAFLRRICGIDENKLSAYLYCYENQNPSRLIKYWSDLTGISKNKFTKPYVRKDFNLAKKGKMQFGLIHIRYCDKKLLLLIKDWINKFAENY